MSSGSEPAGKQRIDLWLKLVCLFKQRSEAADACKGGHVKLNGQRVRPSADVKPGDLVEISVPHYRRVIVEAIPHGSVAKAVARTMYRDETPAVDKSPPQAAVRERGHGRPTKKERREIEKFRW